MYQVEEESSDKEIIIESNNDNSITSQKTKILITQEESGIATSIKDHSTTLPSETPRKAKPNTTLMTTPVTHGQTIISILNPTSYQGDSSPLPDPFVDVNIATDNSVCEDIFGEVIFTRASPMKIKTPPKEFKILVHRGHVFRELINLFKLNPEVSLENDIITAHIILPNGDIE